MGRSTREEVSSRAVTRRANIHRASIRRASIRAVVDGHSVSRPAKKKADHNKKPSINLNGKISKQDGVKSTVTLDSDDGRNIELKVSGDTKITGDSGKLSAADLHVGDEISVSAHTDDKGFFYADAIHLDKVHRGEYHQRGQADGGPTPDLQHRPILASGPIPRQAHDHRSSKSTDSPRPLMPSRSHGGQAGGQEG